MKTNVYIDGFNLYYGMFRPPRSLPWKWLDLRALSERIVPSSGMIVHRIRYFTADVVPDPGDPGQTIRQQTYLRALETIPGVHIHKGSFLPKEKTRPLAQPLTVPRSAEPVVPAARPEVIRVLQHVQWVRVSDREEKGSDVNLASFLLLDAFDSDCDAAIIISNDSDLVTPIRMVQSRFNLDVTVFSPQPGKPSSHLRAVAKRTRELRPVNLEPSLLAPIVHGSDGRPITKPPEWAAAEATYRANNP